MKKSFIFLAVVLFYTTASGQSGINLRMNPEKNKTYSFHSATEQTILQTVNGNQQTVESKSDYAISLKMVDLTPAFIVTEIRIDTIATTTNTMGKTVIMSSASEGNIQSKETSDIMSYFMKRMTKNPLYAKIDFTGKVTEIVNLKMVSDIILKDTSLITAAKPVASALKTQVINMVSDNSFKTIIGMFTNYLPGKLVNTGDNWTVTTSTNSGGMSLDITTKNHLDGISGDNANITAESGIRTSPNAVPMESGGAKITYDDLNGLSKSTIIIDTVTGLIVESVSKTHITGNLGVSMPGMSMQIPMDINSDSKITSIK
jgi:hypothetical protein